MTKENIRSKFWREIAEDDNPFAAKSCYCAGYDVFGEMLGKASWIEYLYLLIKGERPTESQAKILESLAVALANPGLRDHSVRAAMNAAVGGSTSAACLISAVGVGAGRLGGAREVYDAILAWSYCSNNLESWRVYLTEKRNNCNEEVWQKAEHPPGFDPYGNSCALPVIQTLEYLSVNSEGKALPWLNQNRVLLEEVVGMPLSLTGVAAASFIDLEFDENQSEIIFLLLRLPGAMAHSLEQRVFGWRHYPFFAEAMNLQDDPMDKTVKDQIAADNLKEVELDE